MSAVPGSTSNAVERFGIAAPKLAANGYQPVPITPGTKACDHLKGWQRFEFKLGDEKRWRADYTGLRTDYTPAVDIDCTHEEIADELTLLAHDLLGRGLLRFGRRPKSALLYRTEAPFRKLLLEFKLPQLAGQKIEILGKGQQLVAFAVHPDTGAPYTWSAGSPLDTPSAELPKITEQDARKFLIAAEQRLLELGAEIVKNTARRDEKPAQVVAEREPIGLSLDHLREFLDQQDPDTEHDDWLRVLQAVHHETGGSDEGLHLVDTWSSQAGSKYLGSQHVEQRWRSFGTSGGPQITMRSFGFHSVATADDFEDLAANDPPPPSGEEITARALRRFPIEWGVKIDRGQLLNSDYFIKGVLDRVALGMSFGEPGSGKSFLLTDMALAIARGVPWNGHRVRQARVVYISLEGHTGINRRLAAYAEFHAVDLSAIPFAPLKTRLSLLDKKDVLALAQAVTGAGGADLIVIDTLAQATPGGNENSSEDMGKALWSAQELGRTTGAMVLLVHHSGKDSTKGARGWSGAKGAVDVELEVLRDGDRRTVKLSKVKDGRDGHEIPFSLQTVQLGADQDGDEISSCVVSTTPGARPVRQPKGDAQRLVLSVLRDLADMCEDDEPVHLYALINNAVAQMPFDQTQGKRDSRRTTISRAVDSLQRQNFIAIEHGKVALL